MFNCGYGFAASALRMWPWTDVGQYLWALFWGLDDLVAGNSEATPCSFAFFTNDSFCRSEAQCCLHPKTRGGCEISYFFPCFFYPVCRCSVGALMWWCSDYSEKHLPSAWLQGLLLTEGWLWMGLSKSWTRSSCSVCRMVCAGSWKCNRCLKWGVEGGESMSVLCCKE